MQEGERRQDVGDVIWVAGGVFWGGWEGGVCGEAVVEGDAACERFLVRVFPLQVQEGGGGWGEGGRCDARVAPGAAVDVDDPGAAWVGGERGGWWWWWCSWSGRDPDVEGLQGLGLVEWQVGHAGLVPAEGRVVVVVDGGPGHRGPCGPIGVGWLHFLGLVDAGLQLLMLLLLLPLNLALRVSGWEMPRESPSVVFGLVLQLLLLQKCTSPLWVRSAFPRSNPIKPLTPLRSVPALVRGSTSPSDLHTRQHAGWGARGILWEATSILTARTAL